METDPNLIIKGVATFIATSQLFIKSAYWLEKIRRKIKVKKETIEILFDFVADTDVTCGTIHPLYKGLIPPPDKETTALLREWICQYFKRGREEKYSSIQLGPPNWNKHLCSIGGPVNHPHIRYQMGYDLRGENWISILPYFFPLREAKTTGITVQQKWDGNVIIEEPNWYIADRNNIPRFVPRVDQRILQTDFVMIIVTPNTFTQRAFHSNQKHMMIVGAHSAAQLAIKDVLNNNKILGELNSIRGKSEYFQAIIEIPKIKHTTKGELPDGKPILRDLVPLDLNKFQKLKEYEDWKKQVSI